MKSAIRRAALRNSTALAVLTLLATGAGDPALAQSLPSGPTAYGGVSQILFGGQQMMVSQTDQRAAVGWSDFLIGQGYSLQFIQPPSSEILNRVAGPMSIRGDMLANEQVVLVNMNGQVYGSTSYVNVGSLISSTLDIDPFEFINGKNAYASPAGTYASIRNEGGTIIGFDGPVAMISAYVNNSGTINSDKISLVAAQAVEIVDGNVVITKALDQNISGGVLVSNSGFLRNITNSSEGTITLAAAVENYDGVIIENSGVIEGDKVNLLATGGGILNSGLINTTSDGQVLIQASGSFEQINAAEIVTGMLAGGIGGNANISGFNRIYSLGNLNVGGDFYIRNTTGLTQSGDLTVDGTSAFIIIPGQDLILDKENTFGGGVTATARNITIKAAGDLSLTSLNNGQNGSIDLSAGGRLTLPSQPIDTGTGNLSLSSGTVLQLNRNISGENIKVKASHGGIIFGDMTAHSSLEFISDGAFQQVAGGIDADTLTGQVGSIGLTNAGNRISRLGNFYSGLEFGLANSINMEVSGILDSGQVSFSGGHDVTVNGSIQAIRTTVSGGGTLKIGNGGTSGSVTGNVTTDGTLAFNRSDDVEFTGKISGTGNVVQRGTGVLEISNTGNTYTGGNLVEQGTLAGSSASIRGDIENHGNVTLTDDTAARFGDIISGTGSLNLDGTGALTLSGTNTYAGGTTIEAGKTVAVASDRNLGAAGGLLTLNGATLQNTADITAARNIILGSGNGSFSADVGTILALSGDISGPGGLFKEGDGTLLLGGVASYGGPTEIKDGTLEIEAGGSIASSSLLSVGPNGRLAGSGTVGTTVVDAGGHIAPGSSIGTLTVDGDLTLSAGAFLDYEIGKPDVAAVDGRSDRITVSGDVKLDGILNLVQSGDPADGTAGLGYYRLMTYGGALTGDGLTLGRAPILPGAGYWIDAGNGRIDLFAAVTGDDTLQHWQGGNGTWNATATNWLNLDGALPVAAAGNHAVFKDAGSFNGGTVTVEGTQYFKGLQFVDEGYRLEGPGQLAIDGSGRSDGNGEIRVLAERADIATVITGAGGIAKTEAGTLVLSGNNTYSGGTTILGGSVEVAADASLGAISGGLTFDGGTLATSASFDSARTVSLASVGGFDVADGTILGLTGTVSGPGDLVKQGAGTINLTGTNAYGDTRVKAGTLIGNTASISGDIVNAGKVVFDQHDDSSFAGNITGSKGTMVKEGTGQLALSGISTLDWSINSGGLTSSASRFGGNASVGAGASLTLDDAATASYAGKISGTGDFQKSGSGDLRLTGDSSAFDGVTTVSGGRLSVGVDGLGSLGGSISVLNGGLIGGSGTIGTTTIASGGTIAPGNSVGTLTVAGDLTLAPGAIYNTEIAGNGGSDRIAVTGTATIAGSEVAVTALDAKTSYKNGQTYTILTAGNGISGEFARAASQPAFLELDLDHLAKSVDLTIKVKNTNPDPGEPEVPGKPPLFGSVAQTRNQIATAGALDTLQQSGTPLALYNRLLMLDADDARSAFDGLSGEIHASAKSALLEDSRFIRDAATKRLRAAFQGVAANGAPVMAYGEDGPELAPVATDRFAVWGQAFGSWGSTDGDGNASRLDRSTGGFLAGADGAVGDDWRVGLLTGYSHSTFDADTRGSSGTSDNYHLGLYGGGQWSGLGLRGGVAYTWHDIATQRSIAFTGFSDQLGGDYHAGTFQAFGEAGYRFDTHGASFEPFANLAHVSLRTDGFSEKGGAAALTGGSATSDVTFTTLGLRVSTTFDIGDIKATANGTVGWRHAFGDTTPTVSQAFTGSEAFTVAGVPVARNAAIIEAGLDFQLSSKAALAISYDGQLGSGSQQHGFNARLGLSF